jgi:dCMP deaminase
MEAEFSKYVHELRQNPLIAAEKYLTRAYEFAATSRDNSNQNGAILMFPGRLESCPGVNNFPPLVKWDEEKATTRPDKYRYFEHAERDVIYNAARWGHSTKGNIMYCPWASCCPCGRAIITAGISDLVVHRPRMEMTPERWRLDVNEALLMMQKAGVRLHYFEEPLDAPAIMVNGELWSPDTPPKKGGGNWFVGMGMEGGLC